jgi:hypothetical protein
MVMSMDKSSLIAAVLTVFFVLALVAYRLPWAASGVASSAALGQFPKLPKSWRRFLFDEPESTSNR